MDNTDGGVTDGSGNFTLDLSSNPFNGTFPLSATATHRNHLDTLHSDYAFIIAPSLIKRLLSLHNLAEQLIEDHQLFEIFPNPARNECSISFSLEGQYSVRISDSIGRTVKEINVAGEAIYAIDTRNLDNGIYHVQVWSETFLGSRKLILQ